MKKITIKMYFTILDFRNATKMFADPKFNGPELQDDDYNPDAEPVFIKTVPPKDVDPVDLPQGKKKVYVKDVAVGACFRACPILR